ncbi:MAG: hypothetical protein JW915_06465 [Chitinispirillaceae bacterium]|nr:hypothetical protein [Chitinispirillaceae bacterium]
MKDQQTQSKGEMMEELLRNYFISSGYYVVRGIKYKYEGNDITDVDLFLYGRSSGLTRQRINVDIKNKKTPQAFERILWANGLKQLLNFDACIVATTDQRPLIHTFGQLHDTIVLDGSFLSKLRSNTYPDRLTEEELLTMLGKHKSYKTYANKDWRFLYEITKSRLLTELDFSGFNAVLLLLQYFLEKALTDERKREDATRMVYILLSHLLIIIDYIVKDIAFIDQSEKEKKLSDGFKFGNLGKDGVDKIISMAVQIAGNKQANAFLKTLENMPTDILKDFFSKNENAKNLFSWAKELEYLGYKQPFINPESITVHLKGILSVMLDFTNIERVRFFNSYPKTQQTNLDLSIPEKDKNQLNDSVP